MLLNVRDVKRINGLQLIGEKRIYQIGLILDKVVVLKVEYVVKL